MGKVQMVSDRWRVSGARHRHLSTGSAAVQTSLVPLFFFPDIFTNFLGKFDENFDLKSI